MLGLGWGVRWLAARGPPRAASWLPRFHLVGCYAIGLVAAFPWRAVIATAFDDLWTRALSAAESQRDHGPSLRVLVGTDRARDGESAAALELGPWEGAVLDLGDGG